MSSVKGAPSPWICNNIIKYYIRPAARSCQVERSLVSWPRAWLTNTPPTTTTTTASTPPNTPLSLSPPLTHSPAVPVWPRGWLITGRSNISEFMGGLSHTASAPGYVCNPALLLLFLLPKFPTVQRSKWKCNGPLSRASIIVYWLGYLPSGSTSAVGANTVSGGIRQQMDPMLRNLQVHLIYSTVPKPPEACYGFV